jgi:uncharacterized iron-regulated membrane protein
MGLSGVVLVLDRESAGFGFSIMENSRTHEGVRPISDIIIAASQVAGPEFQVSLYLAPKSPGLPAMVRFSGIRREGKSVQAGSVGSSGKSEHANRLSGQSQRQAPNSVAGNSREASRLQVFIDPTSLKILEERRGNDGGVLQWIRRWHTNLLMDGPVGREAVGWIGFALLTLGLSGLVIWWPAPGRWGASFRVRRSLRGVVFLREFHKALGAWSVALLLTSSITGVYLAFPDDFVAVLGKVFHAHNYRAENAAMRVSPRLGATPVNVDEAVNHALTTVDAAYLRAATFPLNPEQPFRIVLGRNGESRGAPDLTVFVDPWTGKVTQVRDPDGFSPAETVVAWLRPVHEGNAFGWPWTVLILISGTLPMLFAVTGMSMWWIRRRAGGDVPA